MNEPKFTIHNDTQQQTVRKKGERERERENIEQKTREKYKTVEKQKSIGGDSVRSAPEPENAAALVLGNVHVQHLAKMGGMVRGGVGGG